MVGISGTTGIGPAPGLVNLDQTAASGETPAQEQRALPPYLLLGLSPQTGGAVFTGFAASPGDTAALIAQITQSLDDSVRNASNETTRQRSLAQQNAVRLLLAVYTTIQRTEGEIAADRRERGETVETRDARAAEQETLANRSGQVQDRIDRLNARIEAGDQTPGLREERDRLVQEKATVDGRVLALGQEIAALSAEIARLDARIGERSAFLDATRSSVISLLAGLRSSNAAADVTAKRDGTQSDGFSQVIDSILSANTEIYLEIEAARGARELDREFLQDTVERTAELNRRVLEIALALVSAVVDVREELGRFTGELGDRPGEDPRVRISL